MTPPDNVLTPEVWTKVRELLTLWLADPEADLEPAVAWCEAWVSSRPYALGRDGNLPWIVAGAYCREHPSQLDRWTRVLGGYRETRRTPWR